MTGLPKRFPRASLINHAAMFEGRLESLMDETQELINETEDHGLAVVTRKLAQRYNALDTARQFVNDARLALWHLP